MFFLVAGTDDYLHAPEAFAGAHSGTEECRAVSIHLEAALPQGQVAAVCGADLTRVAFFSTLWSVEQRVGSGQELVIIWTGDVWTDPADQMAVLLTADQSFDSTVPESDDGALRQSPMRQTGIALDLLNGHMQSDMPQAKGRVYLGAKNVPWSTLGLASPLAKTVPPRQPVTGRDALRWSSFGIGVAAAGGAMYTGVNATILKQSFESPRDHYASEADMNAAWEHYRTLNTATAALAGIAGVGFAVTTATYIVVTPTSVGVTGRF